MHAVKRGAIFMAKPVFKRVLLKISGEALAGNKSAGIDAATLSRISAEIGEVYGNTICNNCESQYHLDFIDSSFDEIIKLGFNNKNIS